MPVKAPFRFARINRWIYEPGWADLVTHDVPFADGLSGEADVEITAKSSILVGADRRKATAGQAGEVRPFQLPDGGYAIPGSALQGMTRAILEVAGFGRLGPWVADRKFGIRDLSGSPTAREHYQNRLSMKTKDHVTIHSKAGWLMKGEDDKPCIVHCEYARIHLDDVWNFKQALLGRPALPQVCALYDRNDAKKRYEWFMKDLPNRNGMAVLNARFDIDKPSPHRHNNGWITITYSLCRHAATGGASGTLVLTGKPQKSVEDDVRGRTKVIRIRGRHKKLEFVFHDPDRNAATNAAKRLPVDDVVWDAFELLHKEQPGRPVNPNWDFWQEEYKKGTPVPVFYWEDGGKVATLGMAFAFKAAHRKSARELLGHSNSGHLDSNEEMKLDLPHLIFGVAAEHDGGRGLKRRARFGLARAERSPQPASPTHPSILLGPKPSYAGLYVRQRHDNKLVSPGEPLATYTPLKRPLDPHLDRPELSGVKIWPARNAGQFKPDPVPQDLKKNLKVQTKLVTLPPRTVFRSRLTFHNLRPVELGALLWALSYGDSAAFEDETNAVTKVHRLGMGKPLGLGEITIRVIGLKTEAASPTSKPVAIANTSTDLVCAFKDHMKSDAVYGPCWPTSKQVAALLKAATPASNPTSDLQYMTLDEYQIAKGKPARRHQPEVPAKYLQDYAPNGSHEKDFPVVGATVGHNPGGPTRTKTWVDEKIASLMTTFNEKDESKILRGQPLAKAWREIKEPTLKRGALQDIRTRWEAKGWWDNPPGGAARKAKTIYGSGT